MALIKCKECGSEISSKAKACPHCGAPTKKEGIQPGCLGRILILVGILVLGGALFDFCQGSENTGVARLTHFSGAGH
jgi:hypothetical protein